MRNNDDATFLLFFFAFGYVVFKLPISCPKLSGAAREDGKKKGVRDPRPVEELAVAEWWRDLIKIEATAVALTLAVVERVSILVVVSFVTVEGVASSPLSRGCGLF